MDDLKRATEVSKQKQMMETLNAFLLANAKELDSSFKKEHRSWDVYVICWVIWVASGFFGDLIHSLGLWFFFGGWFYTFYRGRKLMYIGGTNYGAYKVLHILGYTDWDPDEPGNRKRLKLGVWDEAISTVRGWLEKKKSAQDKVYAPA